MTSPLAGKVALVTGGSRGIGRALASAFVQAGARTYITGRNKKTLDQTAQHIGAHSIVCDHTSETEIQQLIARIRSDAERLDILVNNAGSAHALANVEKLDPKLWREVIDVNLTGTFLTTHFALPNMPDGSTIVNTLSVAARESFAGMSAYNAAKAGALAFSKTLRLELRPRGIRVIALILGATDTDIWNQFWPEAPREKMISPETVAALVLQAVSLPAEVSQDELIIYPTAGTL